MSYRCPKCNSPLSVSILLDTNYDKAKENLQTTINESDPYFNSELWKPSLKKSNLATIRVTPEILEDQALRDLYEKLQVVKSLKILKTNYQLSHYQGDDYLQRWVPLPVG